MSVKSTKQVKYGAILSYLLIILNTVYGLVISPYLIGMLGESQYGVYKTIGSFSATLLVLDLGIGATVMRYTAKYRAENRIDQIGNFAAMGLVEAAVMCVILFLVSIGFYYSIDGMYQNTFTIEEIGLAKSLFILTIIQMFFTLIDNVLTGVVSGCNCFVFTNGFKVTMLVLRAVLLIVVLNFYQSALVLVSISLLISLLSVLAQIIYIRKQLGIHIKFVSWDKGLFRESFAYTALMFIQSLAIQANGNIDNIVIGMVIGTSAVAIYSFAIQLFGMFENLSASFSGLMLPTVSKKIVAGAYDAEMQEVVTKVGRFQFAVLGAALIGFVCVGQEFIGLWLGEGFEDVYYLTLIMMIPVMLVLVQNVCLSILRARNMMKFRTFSLIFTAFFNAVITIFGTMRYGYYAAAIGTGLSILVGSFGMMNIYYHKKIGFKVLKFYRDVASRLLVCTIVPGLVLLILNRFVFGSWLSFLLKVGAYLLLYAFLLMVYGFNKNEKQVVFGKLLRRRTV